ncbi:MAG: DMT family transporter [Mobilicoccus sp.]|nr:DMT family transporter [Mobilicoccus sp.]
MTQRQSAAGGILFALVSAATFGLSGTLGKGLLDLGWSPIATVGFRILIAAVALTVPTVIVLRGRWHLLLGARRLVLGYGLFAIALTQLAYFSAVQTLPVAVALLIEYLAPVLVVGFMWVARAQRPTPLTAVGGLIALAGLVPALGLSGLTADAVGTLWALLAATGLAAFFVLGGEESDLPPLALAGAGLWVGVFALGAVALTGWLPVRVAGGDVTFILGAVPWWGVGLALGIVTAAIAYWTGIAAARALGARVASFVGLVEILFSFLFAALLLAQQPTAMQVLGGLVIVAGIVLVKLGEKAPESVAPTLEGTPGAVEAATPDA